MTKETATIWKSDLKTWQVGRPLTEGDKLDAKLADLSETDAERLSEEELREEAETGWVLAALNKTNLGS